MSSFFGMSPSPKFRGLPQPRTSLRDPFSSPQSRDSADRNFANNAKLHPNHPLAIQSGQDQAAAAKSNAWMRTPGSPIGPSDFGQHYKGFDGHAQDFADFNPGAMKGYLHSSNAGLQGILDQGSMDRGNAAGNVAAARAGQPIMRSALSGRALPPLQPMQPYSQEAALNFQSGDHARAAQGLLANQGIPAFDMGQQLGDQARQTRNSSTITGLLDSAQQSNGPSRAPSSESTGPNWRDQLGYGQRVVNQHPLGPVERLPQFDSEFNPPQRPSGLGGEFNPLLWESREQNSPRTQPDQSWPNGYPPSPNDIPDGGNAANGRRVWPMGDMPQAKTGDPITQALTAPPGANPPPAANPPPMPNPMSPQNPSRVPANDAEFDQNFLNAYEALAKSVEASNPLQANSYRTEALEKLAAIRHDRMTAQRGAGGDAAQEQKLIDEHGIKAMLFARQSDPVGFARESALYKVSKYIPDFALHANQELDPAYTSLLQHHPEVGQPGYAHRNDILYALQQQHPNEFYDWAKGNFWSNPPEIAKDITPNPVVSPSPMSPLSPARGGFGMTGIPAIMRLMRRPMT